MIKNKLSDIVAQQLPQHITESYPTFVEFLQAYYKYLETQKVYRNIETVQMLLRDKKYMAMDKLQTIIAVKERLLKQQDVFEMGFSRFADSRGR